MWWGRGCLHRPGAGQGVQSMAKATKSPSLAIDVYWEDLCTSHLEPERTTQSLDLGERVKPNMLGIVPFDDPLERSPGKRKPTQHIIFNHQLSCWSQQVFQSSQDCFWILEVMKGIGTDNQIKKGRCIGKPGPFSAAQRGLEQVSVWVFLKESLCLNEHLLTGINTIQFGFRQ